MDLQGEQAFADTKIICCVLNLKRYNLQNRFIASNVKKSICAFFGIQTRDLPHATLLRLVFK